MSNPLVSVVLPTYERPDRLCRAATSVAAQTYDRVELVVVDDCSSTPASKTLADVPFDSLTVRHVRHETNKGANEARNTGIARADGEYIAFLDDDDEWKPEKIEQQVATFDQADSETGVVYTGSEYRHDGYERVVLYTHHGDVTRDLLAGRTFGNFSTLMVQRSVIDEAGPPDTAFPSWQDREWLLRLSTCCAFEPVKEPLTIRWCMGTGDRIADNYADKRDISYPRFIEKHRDLAASYGWIYERKFVASLSAILGQAALEQGSYADARKYLLRSCYYYPFRKRNLVYALASLGGEYSYGPLSRLARTLHELFDTETQH